MSNTQIALFQPGQMQVSSVLHGLMSEQQQSELQQNVGASFAVVSIKGKTFGIKHAGQTKQMTVNYNGQLFAAPYFDAVMIKANGHLSKTYYREGYAEGSDSQPDCWSEDGVTPLAPLEQRPIDPRTGQHCTDCRMCPMNAFGSKVTDNGSRGKACADTRKIVVVPVVPTQPGAAAGDPGLVDFDNAQYGGPMLLRVPAGSLRPLAEYSEQLQGMGFPYFGVVTRFSFDPTVAHPKLVMQAVRPLTDGEAQQLVKVRDSDKVKNILESGQTAAPALPSPAQQAAPQASPALQAPQAPQPPAGQTPMATVDQLLQGTTPLHAPPPPAQQAPQVAPVAPAPTGNVVPLHQPQAPAPQAVAPAPVQQATQAPPPPPAAATAAPTPPPGYTMAAGADYAAYRSAGWSDEQMVANGVMHPPAAPAAAPPTPPPPAALAAAPQGAPMPVPPASPQLLQTVDSLLKS